MHWLQSLDTALFHFINGTLGNPLFDWLMPILSGAGNTMRFFAIVLLVGAIVALVRGGARARICVLLLFIVVAAGDPLIVGTIKNAVARPRPCISLNVVERLGCSGSGSMPSAHAANWFAAAMIMLLFYRRSGWFMFPLAAAVAFSRVYCGVHYPSDVTAGAILGAGYAIALVVIAQMAWNFCGKKFFPAWHDRLPSLLNPKSRIHPIQHPTSNIQHPKSELEWLRLGYLVITLALIGRWIYIASGLINLSQDEAYQWLWSKHLALSYYNNPPAIAFIQWLGTALLGDTELGVRFCAPLFAAILSWLVLRFMAREIGARKAFLLLLITFATPLLVAGAILMTVDLPLVLCWMWAVIAGWRAVQANSKTRDWLVVGLATGLGFLCTYIAVFLPVCGALFFGLQPSARHRLHKPGPWLALGVLSVCVLPVVIWNWQHGWITLDHVAGDAGLQNNWHPTLNYFFEFFGSELGWLNPIFFVGAMWACVAFWKNRLEKPLQLFLFCMGGPVFFGCWLFSLHSRVPSNWIAAALLPLFCLMAHFWADRLEKIKPWLATGMILGLFMSVFMYDGDLLGKIIARLPGDKDPSHRVRGWRETAQLVEKERTGFDPGAFVIADNYGTTGLYSFYLPAARADATSGEPRVYCIDADQPSNQFNLWDEYNYRAHRQGQNAIFVSRLEPYPLEDGWIWKWLRREPIQYGQIPPPPPLLRRVTREFETVTNLGIREITLRDGRVFQRVQIYGC